MYTGLLKDRSAVITFPRRCQEYVGWLFVYVPQNVKVVYSWIFPLKSIHGKPFCDKRLPAEQTKSESSVPAIVLYSEWEGRVRVCTSMCKHPFILVWFIFNMHSLSVSVQLPQACRRIWDANRFLDRHRDIQPV